MPSQDSQLSLFPTSPTPPESKTSRFSSLLIGVIAGIFIYASLALLPLDTQSSQLNIKQLANQVSSSVVNISTLTNNQSSASGTGIIVSSSGEILTNNHVIDNARLINVQVKDYPLSFKASLVGTDPQKDLAIIKIEASNLIPANLQPSSSPEVGDQVVAIGNSLGLTGSPSVTTGIVSALNRSITENSLTLQNLIQTDAAINPGNSGGPLLNSKGEVIGVNTAVVRGADGQFEGVGFAISIDSVNPLLSTLRQGQTPAVASLGVQALPFTPVLKEQHSLETPVEKGAYVVSVTSDSPAAQAGIQAKDVIVAIEDTEINSSDDLVKEVQTYQPGDRVNVTLYRNAERLTIQITLTQK